jgi:hypothetical protein
VIGGLDFTNVKIVQELFGMKIEEKKPVVTNTTMQPAPFRTNNNNSNRKEERGEIDFKVKYRSELVQLKSNLQDMGVEKSEDDLLLQLINTGGDIQRAIYTIFDPPV